MFFRKKSKKIYSPICGTIIPLEEVNDPVFSKKMMGDGLAILPKENLVVAPCDGKISALVETNHAIGITTEEGIELIIHIGLETTNLHGNYFKPLIHQDEKVKKGQSLIEFDREKLSHEGYDTIVILVVPNTNKKRLNKLEIAEVDNLQTPIIELI